MATPLWLKQWRLKRKVDHFKSHGRIPWSRGYEEHKQEQLYATLAHPAWNPVSLPPGYGLGLDERIVEIPWLIFSLPPGPGRLLDAGSSLNHALFLRHPRLAEKKIHICTLAPEKECFWSKGVSYVFEDLRKMPYRDGNFDHVCCISTLEHVGMDNTQKYTADPRYRESKPGDAIDVMREFTRILRPGGTLFLTVPFGIPENFGWLRVFDAEAIDGLIRSFAPEDLSETIFRYQPGGWVKSDRSAAATARYCDRSRCPAKQPGWAAAAEAVCCLAFKKSSHC